MVDLVVKVENVRVYGCQNEGVFIKATKSLKKAVLNQKLRKTPKN